MGIISKFLLHVLVTLLGFAALFIWSCIQKSGVLRSNPKWNVIVVTLDTTRADHLGCYGYEAALTPTLDALAKRGVLFERAYAPCPLTLPSHATMFTGLHPAEHSLMTNGKGRLPDDVTTLAEVLSEHGYATSAFVSSFVLNRKFGLDQGIRDYDDRLSGVQASTDILHRERDGKSTVDASVEWIAKHCRERFSCWIHLYDPHYPYVAHEPLFGEQFANQPYDAEIAFVDRQLSRVFDLLKAQGLEDNTLVVVVGDHGESLGEHQEPNHGYLLYEATQHVPLIVVVPKSAKAGVRVSGPVPLLDLFPTILELLGLEVPTATSGQSLAGVWKNEEPQPRVCLGMTDEPLLDNGWSGLRSLTKDEWKYIRSPKPELYRLDTDPHELSNCVGEFPEVMADLEAQLEELEQQMRVRKPVENPLSNQEKKLLAGLGYTGGLRERDPTSAPGPDVKDMLPLANALATAMELLEHGETEQAEVQLRAIVEKAPTYLKAVGNLGICLARQGRIGEAIECYERVLKLDPRDANALSNLAAAFVSQGDQQKAVEHYRAAMAVDPDSAVPAFQLGLLYQKLGDNLAAADLFAEAVRRDPQYEEAFRAWGDLETSMGHPDQGRQRYQQALAANPESIPSLVNLGILEARSGQIKVAIDHFQRALQIDPRDTQARQNLAFAYELVGRNVDAANEYDFIVQETPDHLPAVMSLGWLRAASADDSVRNGVQAIELGERACKLTEQAFAPAYDLLGAAYAEAKQFDRAEQATGTAIRLMQQAANKTQIAEVARRLELFRQRKPFRKPKRS